MIILIKNILQKVKNFAISIGINLGKIMRFFWKVLLDYITVSVALAVFMFTCYFLLSLIDIVIFKTTIFKSFLRDVGKDVAETTITISYYMGFFSSYSLFSALKNSEQIWCVVLLFRLLKPNTSVWHQISTASNRNNYENSYQRRRYYKRNYKKLSEKVSDDDKKS